MAGIDLNRTTSGVVLPPAVSNDILQTTQEASIVQRLGRQITMPGSGISINSITSDPVAAWVNETDEKPVSRPTVGSKTVTPYKVAVIVPFSNEFARDLPTLYGELRRRIPGALAKKFDQTVLFGPAPGSGFDTLAASPTVSVAAYSRAQVLGAVSAVSAVEDADLSAWLLSAQAEVGLLGAVDSNGNGVYAPNPLTDGVNSIGSLFGRPVFRAKAAFKAAVADDDGAGPHTAVASTVGFAGDWSKLSWGSVSGVQVRVSTEATLHDGSTTIHLFQRNMFAVLVEAEYGCVIENDDAFVRLTG